MQKHTETSMRVVFSNERSVRSHTLITLLWKIGNWQAKRNPRQVCVSLMSANGGVFALFYCDYSNKDGIKIRRHLFKTSSGYTQFGLAVMTQNREEKAAKAGSSGPFTHVKRFSQHCGVNVVDSHVNMWRRVEEHLCLTWIPPPVERYCTCLTVAILAYFNIVILKVLIRLARFHLSLMFFPFGLLLSA